MSATAHDKLPRPRRLIEPEDIVCPAGCPARAGTSVLCRIEHEVIDGRLNPYSLRDYCLGDYRTCSTWRAEKEAVAEGQRGAALE
jgi:hypothetical protein